MKNGAPQNDGDHAHRAARRARPRCARACRRRGGRRRRRAAPSGTSTRLSGPSSIRSACGTIRPTKPMGPDEGHHRRREQRGAREDAALHAARRPRRAASALSSPSARRLSGRAGRARARSPSAVTGAKTARPAGGSGREVAEQPVDDAAEAVEVHDRDQHGDRRGEEDADDHPGQEQRVHGQAAGAGRDQVHGAARRRRRRRRRRPSARAPRRAPARSPNTWASTTPNAAPLETPRTEGSASGLRVRAWKPAPATARAPPASSAAAMRGRRRLSTTTWSTGRHRAAR